MMNVKNGFFNVLIKIDNFFFKCLIFMCYFAEKLIALNVLQEVVPTWYTFHS